MTPFAHLEKSARFNLSGISSGLRRGFRSASESALGRGLRGAAHAPADVMHGLMGMFRGKGIETMAQRMAGREHLGQAGALGSMAGVSALQGGMVGGAFNALTGGKQKAQPDASKGEQRMGAVHPDMQKMWDEQGTPNGPGHARWQEMLGTGMQQAAKKPWINNPFTTEGRQRIDTSLRNVNEAMSPMMKQDELTALYGEGPAAQFRAMNDPLRMQKRMQYREKAAARGEQLLKRLIGITRMAEPGVTALRDVDPLIARAKLPLLRHYTSKAFPNDGLIGMLDTIGSGHPVKDPGAQVRALLFGRVPGAGGAAAKDSVAKAIRQGLSDPTTQESGRAMSTGLLRHANDMAGSLAGIGRKRFQANSLSSKDLLR